MIRVQGLANSPKKTLIYIFFHIQTTGMHALLRYNAKFKHINSKVISLKQ